jgi:hypothetical protein
VTVTEQPASFGQRSFSPALEAERLHQEAGTVELLFTPRRFALLLGLLLCAAYPDVLFGERTFFYRDFGIFGYPLAHYHRECFWRGEVPLWNPLNNCGVPFLAQWNTMTFYPGSLVYLLLPLSWALGVFGPAHLFLGGMGAYWLALRWTRNPLAASVAGLVAAFNGFATYSLVWPQVVAALGWMPWVVGAAERAWRDGGGRRIIAASLIGAVQMLTGAVEVIALTWMMTGALLISEAFPRRRHDLRTTWILSGRFIAVVAPVTALTAVQLLPFFELLANSQRNAGFHNSDWALSWNGAASLLVPLFHTFRSFHGVFMQHSQQWVGSVYVGAAVVALAPLALGQRNRRAWILAGAAAGGLLLALGENGWIYEPIRRTLPQLDMMRFPVKFMILPVFAMPLLAAFAVARLRMPRLPEAKPASWKSLLATVGLAALGIVFILWTAHTHPWPKDDWPATFRNGIERLTLLWICAAALIGLRVLSCTRWQCILAPVLLLVLWIDLRTHAPGLSPTVERSVFGSGVTRDHLKLHPSPAHGQSRAFVSPEALAKLRHVSVETPEQEILGRRLAMFGNLNLLDGLPKVNGFYALYPKENEEFLSLLYPTPAGNVSGLLQFLGVSHVTTAGTLTDWSAQKSFQPLATAGQKPVFADEAETLGALANPQFDPREQVFLPAAANASIPITNRTDAGIVSQLFESQRAEIVVEAREPSLVVIAQTFYPAWCASIDGTATTLWRANHAFQALVVPAGRHLVTLKYEDRAFRRGAVISSLALLACGMGWACSRRRNVNSAPQPR